MNNNEMNEVDAEYLDDLRKAMVNAYSIISSNALLIRATLNCLEGTFPKLRHSEAVRALRESAEKVGTNVQRARLLTNNVMTPEYITKRDEDTPND